MTLSPFRRLTDDRLESPQNADVPMTFIRAPYINKVGDGVDILAQEQGHIVAARQANQLVTAFHPELNSSTAVHEYFLRMASESN